MTQDNIPPAYPMPTQEERQAALVVAVSRNLDPQIHLSTAAGAVDINAQPTTYPMPNGPVLITVDSFFRAAEAEGFTPTVVVQRHGGIPAKHLQTRADILIPQDTELIVGINLPGTTFYQVARAPHQHFTLRVDLGDMQDGGISVPRPSLDLLTGNVVEVRTEGFYGLESLIALQTFAIKGIGGIVNIQAGDLICYGLCPIPAVKNFAILCTIHPVTENATGYIIIQQSAVQEMLADSVLAFAVASHVPLDPNFHDYTVSYEAVSAARQQEFAQEDFEACGEQCQIVRIRRGDLLELRYKQANGFKYCCNLTTGDIFARGPME
ncbi:hypothetical protein CLAFUR0_07562 [Fulvia fulva]|nr:hypothetical protein CLAFUR0_07562 [Fulvia fulva]